MAETTEEKGEMRGFHTRISECGLRKWHRGEDWVGSDGSKKERETKDNSFLKFIFEFNLYCFKHNSNVCKEPRLMVILSIYIVHMHPSQLFLFHVKVISCARITSKTCVSDLGDIRHQNI